MRPACKGKGIDGERGCGRRYRKTVAGAPRHGKFQAKETVHCVRCSGKNTVLWSMKRISTRLNNQGIIVDLGRERLKGKKGTVKSK